ncbi:hypothetical protein TSUD_162070 [Trifolium subterraneum]|uniref:Uncharacterized protein n=1 Tax=Trifolium subterraneum TaxID=3900 RepID=A0A2Z6MYY1_TRISU|nr:hypothetical protein TSUD_162070 [Trifolium subterraneum]
MMIRSSSREYSYQHFIKWVPRLVKNPAHFRCGFDIVLPWHEETGYGNRIIAKTFHHWFKGGAHITLKSRQGLIIKEWGLRAITKKDTEDSRMKRSVHLSLENVKVKQRNTSSFEPKIQLPYNWLVSDKDEAERDEAKGKETDLFSLGLFTEISQ